MLDLVSPLHLNSEFLPVFLPHQKGRQIAFARIKEKNRWGISEKNTKTKNVDFVKEKNVTKYAEFKEKDARRDKNRKKSDEKNGKI